MNTKLTNLFNMIQVKMLSEDGQDLIEYALVVALIAFGATAGMSALAGKLNTAFNTIGNSLTTYTS